jgi:hypothetical protein
MDNPHDSTKAAPYNSFKESRNVHCNLTSSGSWGTLSDAHTELARSNVSSPHTCELQNTDPRCACPTPSVDSDGGSDLSYTHLRTHARAVIKRSSTVQLPIMTRHYYVRLIRTKSEGDLPFGW